MAAVAAPSTGGYAHVGARPRARTHANARARTSAYTHAHAEERDSSAADGNAASPTHDSAAFYRRNPELPRRGVFSGGTVFLDAANCGVAGDMLLAALLDCGAPLRVVEAALAATPLRKEGVRVECARSLAQSGVDAARVIVRVGKEAEGENAGAASASPPERDYAAIRAMLDAVPVLEDADLDDLDDVDGADVDVVDMVDFIGDLDAHAHTHGHTHGHEDVHAHAHTHTHAEGHIHTHTHTHTHTHADSRTHARADTYARTRARRGGRAGMTAGALALARGAFARLARAEARVHGIADADEVRFHEVGCADSIADVLGAAAALDYLGATHVVPSPLPVGRRPILGAAHGPLPNPPPATLALLAEAGLPTFSAGGVEVGELVTPTGACLVAEAATERAAAWPAGGFVAERVGYGAGSRRVAGRANLFAVVVGRRVGGV